MSVAISDKIAWLRTKYSRERTWGCTYDVVFIVPWSVFLGIDQILTTLLACFVAVYDAAGDMLMWRISDPLFLFPFPFSARCAVGIMSIADW